MEIDWNETYLKPELRYQRIVSDGMVCAMDRAAGRFIVLHPAAPGEPPTRGIGEPLPSPDQA